MKTKILSKIILTIALLMLLTFAMSDCISLKSEYICVKNNKHCAKYECGPNHCAINKKTCSLFSEYSASFVKNDQTMYGYSLAEYFKRLKYETFLARIRACSWLSTEVCMKKHKFNKSDCQSKANLSFKCGNKYCTSNKSACEALNNKLRSDNMISIRKCKALNDLKKTSNN